MVCARATLRLVPTVLCILALTGCGGGVSGCALASCVTTITATPTLAAGAATATDHGWTTSATFEPESRQLRVDVLVPGPLQVDGGCIPGLTTWLVGPDQRRIDPSASPGLRCRAVQIEDIPAGEKRTFTARIPDPGYGTYTVHGLLRVHLQTGAGARVDENIPVATVTIP
ncbi:MAG: hypothetical protein NVSMB17_11740 [Candidatus Dormibacteria bacterium]